jgi:hypothetical protein
VFEGLARHIEFRAIAVEVAEVDDKTPFVHTEFGNEEHAGDVAGVVGALPSPAGFEAWKVRS